MYIFDELITALDKGNRERFSGLLRELSDGRIVVVITYEKELLEEAAWVVEMGASS